MKKRITFLSAALMLLAFLAVPLGMRGAEGDTHPMGITQSTLLNNGASIPSINIDAQDYPVSKVTINWRYNKTIQDAVTMEVVVGGVSWGTQSTGSGTGSNYVDTEFEGTSTIGGIVINFTNNTGNGTGHGTFYIGEITLTEGASGTPAVTHTLTFSANPTEGGTVTIGSSTSGSITLEEGATTSISATANVGYVFGSWTVGGEGSSVNEAGDTFTMGTEDATLTANFTEVTTYTVTYHANVTGIDDIEVAYNAGDDVTVAANTFSNPGFAFSEWNTQPDGDGDPYVAGNVIENIQANIDLYAQWTEAAPFTGGDVTFDATIDKDLNNTSQGEGTIVKDGVTFHCDNGILGNGTEYRLYKNSTTTFSVTSGTITQIVFTCPSGNPASGFGQQAGWTTNGSNGTWAGNATSVSFVASSKQVRATQIVVTVETSGTPNPTISANNVSIAYDATEGSIAYTIENGVDGGTLTAATQDEWLTLGTVGETVPFTCTANEAAFERTATVTLTYTYGDEQTVTKDVTVTQASDPNYVMTIAEARALTDGTTVLTSGIVTSKNGTTSYIQDATGAIVVYNSNDPVVGHYITVEGVLTTFKGLREIGTSSNAPTVTVGEEGTVTPTVMTIEAINTDASGSNSHQAKLVRIENAIYNNGIVYQGENNITVYGTMTGVNDNDVVTFTANIGCYNTVQLVNMTDITVQAVPSIAVNPATVNVDANGHEDYLAINLQNIEVTDESNFEIYFYESDGTTTADYSEWLDAEVIPSTNEGYEVYCVIQANTGEARQAYLKVYVLGDDSNEATSELVTINQDAYVAPSTGSTYALYEGALTEGDYIIYYNGSAMKNRVENGRLYYEEVAPENDVITTSDATIVWHIAQIGDYWTIYSADTDAYAAGTGVKNKAQMLEDGTSDYAMWTVSGTEEYEFVNKGNSNDGVNAYLRNNVNNNNNYGFACYAVGTGGDLSLYKKNIETETYELHVNGYGDSEGGYVLLASPVYANPTNTGMITDDGTDEQNLTYDFYYFDQSQDLEWINYRAHNFNIVPGKGYLYASKNGVDLTFTGTPYSGDGQITLKKTTDAEFEGWNLIGNPFGNAATIDKAYYKLKEDGSDVNPETENSAIDVMEGVFVVAETNGETVTFTEQTTPNNDIVVAQMNINVSKSRGESVDRAIVRFDNGNQLPKFQLNPNHTKVYIPQGNNDYAIVRSDAQGEMPVNFKADKNGTYTISINAENVEMEYLHLIDNMTGADIDLLATPSYTFDANTTDYASRFRLVFNGNTVNENGNETFAYFNGSEWSISNTGRATLQVVDMLGRIVSSESVSGNTTLSTTNLKDGVYMFRLVNGENVKVQKVVVK